MSDLSGGKLVVLFDGVCNLCNGAVNFIIDHDPRGRFVFAALQSDIAKVLLRECGAEDKADLSTMILIENGHVYTRSTAAVRIARQLNGIWPIFAAGVVVPPVMRDAVYNWIARNRYRWFGREESCRLPTPALAARFLDNPYPAPANRAA